MNDSCGCTRRDAIKGAIGCGSYVMLSLGAMGTFGSRLFAQERGETIRSAPFARVEKIADGFWAVIATPKGGYEAVSNSGIIRGRDGVLVVDASNSAAGSRFVAETAKALTGRAPTHVVLTHHHGDHANGLCGHLAANADVRLVSTAETRDLLLGSIRKGTPPGDDGTLTESKHTHVVPNTVFAAGPEPVELDLGGVVVRLVSRRGHTPSDVTVEIVEPRIVWCGDLVFNGLFPYYGDATPSVLAETCASFLKDPGVTYVPGHGPVTDAKGLKLYLALLDHVGAAARDAHAKGIPPGEAWKRYTIPESLGPWDKFRPDVYRFAFEAWARELGGGER